MLEEAPATMPDTVPWKGSEIPFDEFLTTTHTNSFLVLQDGRLAYEWYADGVDGSTRQSSFSMAKSLVSLLVGQAIGRGELTEDDRVVDLLPGYATGGEYDDVTVRELLDMTAGVDVSEVYNEYWPFTGTSRMYLTTDLPGFVHDHRSVDYTRHEGRLPQRRHRALGLILAEVTGQNLSDLLSEGIWKLVGAEESARWNLDHEGGVEKAFASVNATARDFARVGQLVLDDGRVDGRQVVPRAWITRIETPAPLEVDGWEYSRAVVAPRGRRRRPVHAGRLRPVHLRQPRDRHRHRQAQRPRHGPGRAGDLRRAAFGRGPRQRGVDRQHEQPDRHHRPAQGRLHLHIEGTLEPELIFELASRHGMELPYASLDDLRARYAFEDLQSFLDPTTPTWRCSAPRTTSPG